MSPLKNQVMFAAGNVSASEQVMLRTSPTLYEGLNPFTVGRDVGLTAINELTSKLNLEFVTAKP